jgi:hypothetical protein
MCSLGDDAMSCCGGGFDVRCVVVAAFRIVYQIFDLT